MHTIQKLPQGWRLIDRVNLQEDKRAALAVNGIAAAVMMVMLIAGQFVTSLFRILTSGRGIGEALLHLIVMVVGMVAYIVMHELTHAAVMRLYGAKQVRFGFTGMYAYAGSEKDYFDRRAYTHIALAPLIVWTALLTLLCALVPEKWFWVAYWIQIINVSGAMGDVYVTWRFSRLSSDILVMDIGIEMSVYARERRI